MQPNGKLQFFTKSSQYQFTNDASRFIGLC